MAKKLVKIKAVGCIHYSGEEYLPGDTFECDAKEADRLKEQGVAAAFVADSAEKTVTSSAGDSDQDEPTLLEKIAAAKTKDEVLALLPEEAPEDAAYAAELTEAVKARFAELEV